MGDLFSVMDLRCVNYTAEFRWRIINTQLADTLLHLSCHNTTNVCSREDPIIILNKLPLAVSYGISYHSTVLTYSLTKPIMIRRPPYNCYQELYS